MGPKAGFYSPLACANCHTEIGEDPQEVYRTPPSFAQLPPINLLQELPSPSECPAEIFWPSSLTTYQDFVQKNPYLRSQNYLTTLAISRSGQFPARFNDSSLETYLGLKGGAALPFEKGPFSFETAHDAELCAGPVVGDGCAGWKLDVQGDDFGIILPNRNWISAKDLEIGFQGISGHLLTGVSLDGIALREGKLIASLRLVNPLLNSTVPWSVPLFTGQQLQPNPFSPDLYDLDLTGMLLGKIPVAYDSDTRKAVNWKQYQESTSKETLKILPYFYQWARSGRLPERLSINRLYETVSEFLANTDRESQGSTDWSSFIGKFHLKGKIRPDSIIHPKIYAEFSPEPDKNQIEFNVEAAGPGETKAYVHVPLHLSRFYLPGIFDILDFQGRLELVASETQDLQIFLHDLDMELGRIDFLGGPDRPGKITILGGRVSQGPTLDPLLLTPEPALKIEGNADRGYEIRLNLSISDLKIILPFVGEASFSGDLVGQIRILSEKAWVTQADGSYALKTHYRIDPRELELRFENGSLVKTDGWSAKELAMKIAGMESAFPLASDLSEAFLTVGLELPKIIGSSLTSAQLDGGFSFPYLNGAYDFSAFLKNPQSAWHLSASRADGQKEEWDLSWDGKTEKKVQKHDIALRAQRSKPSAGTPTALVDDLKVHVETEGYVGGSRYNVKASARGLALGDLHLAQPKLLLEWNVLESSPKLTTLTIPTFEFSANSSRSSALISQGWIRGPIWIKDKSGTRKPFTVVLDKAKQILEVKNLRMNFGVQKITPPDFRRATKGKLSSVDIDGTLKADWTLDLAKTQGRGSIELLGDGEGDIHLRDAKGLRLAKPDPRDPDFLVETPMFSQTSWRLTKIREIDMKNQRILGNFRLETEIDPAIARSFGIIVDSGKVVSWQMNHDHLPYTPKGFFLKMSDYLVKKLREESQGGATP